MRQLRIGLVGAGLIARIHGDAWLRAGAQVRVHSDDGRACELAAELGATAVESLEEALDGADAVDICTPTRTHRDIALAAIAAGAAVVCEKPLAATAAEAEEIVDAAERAGLSVSPAHNMRFAPAFHRLHELVAGGALGTGAVARFTAIAHHPRPWTEEVPEEAGGILTDQMLHCADAAYWIFGDVVRVYAQYRGKIASPAPEGTVAVGTAVLTHAGGAVSQIVAGWAAPPTPLRVTYHVSGTGGTVRYDSTDPLELRITGGEAGAIPQFFGESPFVAEIGEFAEALRGGPEPRLGARDALAAVRITQAAAESAWTGRAVTLATREQTP